MSKITPLYNQLRARAAATGEDRHADLAHGARLVVRVRPTEQGQRVVLTIARRGARVGTAEEVVFKRDCQVPAGATRVPADPTQQEERERDGDRWHLVGYRWEEVRDAAASA